MLSYIHNHLREENLTPVELTEVIFIDVEFESLSAGELKGLEQYENLEFISFAECGLKSVEAAFPSLPNCAALIFSNNELTDEVIPHLVKLCNLESLALDGNRIESLEKFKLLSIMPKLREISLSDCPVAASEDYRERLFEILPQLEIIDDMNRDGEVIEFEESDESDDSSEEFSEEGSPFDIGELYQNEEPDSEASPLGKRPRS